MHRLLGSLMVAIYLIVLSLIVTDIFGWILSGIALLLAGTLHSVFRFARGQLQDESLSGAAVDIVFCSVGFLFRGGHMSRALGEQLYYRLTKIPGG